MSQLGGRDFGAVREGPRLPRVRRLAFGVTTVAGVAVVAAIILLQARRQDAEAKAEDAAWSVQGPPCPVITPAAYRRLAIAHPQSFAFETLAGVRAHGDVSCSETDLDHGRHVAAYAVCQLTDPLALRLATRQGDVYFEPGVGQPATLSMPGGQLRCVMAANPANW